jgi:hypothetical protein
MDHLMKQSHTFITKLLLVFPLLIVTVVNAQESPSVSVGQDRKALRLKFDLLNAIPRSEFRKLEDIGNYRLYELVKAEDVVVRVANEIERINSLSDPGEKSAQLRSLADQLRNPPPNLLNANPPKCELDCARITVGLTSRLDYDKTYVLTIAGVVLDNNPIKPVEFKIEKTAAIVEALEASKTRKELRIQSTGPLAVSSSSLTVEEKVLRINAAGTRADEDKNPLPAVATQPKNLPNLIEVKLNKELTEGKAHTLSIPGNILTDGTGVSIAAKGTITIAGLPSPPDDPELTLEVASNAAVHSKPQFDFDFGWVPEKRPLKLPLYWRPEVKADVGLGDTKSDNAISLALLGMYSSHTSCTGERTRKGSKSPGKCEDPPPDVQLRAYYSWRTTPWYRLARYDFFVGPKLEADRAFDRINMLGTARFEFRFHRWIATINEKRDLLRANLNEDADLVEINNGFRLIPYLSFDFGGSVRNETVENKDKNVSISVPRYSIFRTNVGVKSLFQWRLFSFPMTLTLEERLMYLAQREDIAFETDEGVGFRSMRGFHHRGEAEWRLAFDPAQHFNFTITYENGRKAPNFEYLNKVSTGFKIIF